MRPVAALAKTLANILIYVLPVVVLLTGLLMISNIRYPHIINRYLKGRKSIARVITVVILFLLIVVAHRYILGIGCLLYALWGPMSWAYARSRRTLAPASSSGSRDALPK